MSEETIILHLKTGTFCYSHVKVRTACKGTSCLGPSHSNILCPVPTGTVCCVFHKGAGEEAAFQVYLTNVHHGTLDATMLALFFPIHHPTHMECNQKCMKRCNKLYWASSKGLAKQCLVCKTSKTCGFQGLYHQPLIQ